MGRSRLRAALVLAFVVALVGSAAEGLRAQDAPRPVPAVRYGASIAVRPGTLTGQVLFPDGKSPAADVAVKVWSVERGAYVAQTVTDANGAYILKALPVGRHLLVVGGRVSVDVHVVEKAEHTGPLNVIIPHGVGPFAQMSPEHQAAVLVLMAQTDAAQGPATRRPLRTVLIIGGGTATAIGTVVAIDEIGDGHHGGNVVSP